MSVLDWLVHFFHKEPDRGDRGEKRAVHATSRSSKIEQQERQTDDAIRRLRALGVRVDVYEIRHRSARGYRRS